MSSFKKKKPLFFLGAFRFKVSVCKKNSSHLAPTNSILACFLYAMGKKSVNFQETEYYCNLILDAILEDCPNKERAIEDGIDFG
ncbi:MAG: hypothetical protein KAJ58_02135 [Candidatus Pacebacteria bacterium]|nr:hypothetical protein [Candidatus Paceibacterota bacterium]